MFPNKNDDVNFFSAIHLDLNKAIERNDMIRFEKILSDINEKNPIVYKDSKRLYSALHRAAYYGKVDIIKLLDSKGVNITQYNNIGETPMHIAALKNKTDVVSYYLNSSKVTYKNPKTDLTVFKSKGRTPIAYAAQLEPKSPSFSTVQPILYTSVTP